MLPAWMRQTAKKVCRWLRAAHRLQVPRRVPPEQTFCVLAWKHLQINPEGTAKLCCRAAASVCDADGQPLSLDTHSLDDIWHSSYMTAVRRKMTCGEPLPECVTCYASEAAGHSSYRTHSNEKWLGRDGLTLADAIRQARRSRDFLEEHPVFFQLNLGNLCNLRCRMCSSSYSSQIEADPVHREWAPRVFFNDSGLARWSGETLVLRPARFRDVTGANGGVWTGGGTFIVPVGECDRPTDLEIRLADELTQRELRVSVNGVSLYRGVPTKPGWPERFDLSDVPVKSRLEVTVETVQGGEVAVVEATLRRTMASARRAGFNNVTSTRFEQPGDWHTQDRVIFDEILRRIDTLQELYFTGGEPLISKKFHQILEFLVVNGVAQKLTLQLNSNITKLTDAILEKLSQFHRVTFTLSLDGFGDVYEYIRYPAKWAVVAANAQKLTRLANADVQAIPVVTAYNVLSLTDLFRFCDKLGIGFRLSNCYGPEWLMLKVLPPKVIELAAHRLLDYAERECRPGNRQVVQTLGDALWKGAVEFRPDLVATFQTFTNELDVSRAQSFARTFPELVELMAQSGYPWTAGRRVELLPLGLPTKTA